VDPAVRPGRTVEESADEVLGTVDCHVELLDRVVGDALGVEFFNHGVALDEVACGAAAAAVLLDGVEMTRLSRMISAPPVRGLSLRVGAPVRVVGLAFAIDDGVVVELVVGVTGFTGPEAADERVAAGTARVVPDARPGRVSLPRMVFIAAGAA